MVKNNEFSKDNIDQFKSDYIDLKELINFFLRSKIKIIAFACIGLSLGVFKALSTKRTWQGEFQIVIAKQNSSNSPSQAADAIKGNIDIANFLGLKGGDLGLNTEVEILKSPSVLFPVFQFDKQKKSLRGIETNSWAFDKWEKDLGIMSLDGTSILSVTFLDQEKDDIIPVLNQVINEYKKYSQRDRQRSFKQGLTYLKNQIKNYQEKGLDSRKKLQEYSLKYNLSLKGLKNDGMVDLTILDIEKTKVLENEKIRVAELRLKQLENMNSFNEVFSFAKLVFPNDAVKNLESSLERLTFNEYESESIFTENSSTIKRFKEVKNSMYLSLKQELKTFLEVAISDSKSKIEASERPKGVIMKYKELIREATRDELTLARLENNERLMKLDQARESNPWEVITQPTLRETPVAPKRKLIALQSLILGSIIGLGFSFYREKIKGLIYSEKTIKEILGLSKLENIFLDNQKDFDSSISFLIEVILNLDTGSQVYLRPIGNINDNFLDKVVEKMNSKSEKIEFILNKDKDQNKKNGPQILILEKGNIKRKELVNIKKRLTYSSDNLLGWILIK